MTSSIVNPTASAAAIAADPPPNPLAIDAGVVASVVVGFVREEVRKVGFERVVVGLSGGVDSAVVAAIAALALGPERVHAVLMPYRLSSPASEADARIVAQHLQIDPTRIDISPQIDAYYDVFPGADRGRRGNKMARERMSILYDMSSAYDALVLGTSNKTELLLGYGTVHGDMAHALNPIGDLFKTQVFALARHLGLPQRVIEKPPSADLWEGQSDEDELGFTYERVDQVLMRLVDERQTRAEVIDLGFEGQFVDSVLHRVRASQYKRRLPLIAKLSSRTLDREFRYPRDWGR